MASALDSPTSVTLLGRLRLNATDPVAWSEFVGRYGPEIYRWCRRWNLQDADAQDVTQIVLQKLARTMRSFAYDASLSFRGWLKTLAHHAWRDFAEAQRRAGWGSGDDRVLELLRTVEAGEDLLGNLEVEFERELLEEAMARVRLRVTPRSWEAFRLLALEGRPGSEVASGLGLSVAAAYMAKNRVKTMLRREIDALRGPDRE
ncbi:MAG TPA: sigma-70 family RNA polymerase sigma factor [Isosphaeraceae bacterium]|jgi:RNA polymerase sigma-70 factor (ECF subfamily)